MNSVRQAIIKTTAALLIGILALGIANQAVFIHSHQTENGQFITHAHPYQTSDNNSKTPSHQHSKIQLLVFSQLNLLFLLAFLYTGLLFFPAWIKHNLPQSLRLFGSISHKIRNRAPPAYLNWAE